MLETEKRNRAEDKAGFKVEIENLGELLCSLAGRRRSVAGEIKSPDWTCVQPTFGGQEERQAAVSPFGSYSESHLDDGVHQSLKEELFLAGVSDIEWSEQASPTESNELAPSCDETAAHNDMSAQVYQEHRSERNFSACSSTCVKLNAPRSYVSKQGLVHKGLVGKDLVDEGLVDVIAVVTADATQGEDGIGCRMFLKDESRIGAPSVEAIIDERHFPALPKAHTGYYILLKIFAVRFDVKERPYLKSRPISAWCIWNHSGEPVHGHEIQIHKAELDAACSNGCNPSTMQLRGHD
ncbi:hypothetical protein PMIN01_13413 [Paraphaeosphaeria minitans]|uniref:Uncharacterized protein n=1 Tax=Paraphaeosphaeria minitans TaxID=565426 RepID=A0A9P6G663_9PLEO|nr:hypothetical protein PMIN01_13413 [Paraphaeosphaeria minitans]